MKESLWSTRTARLLILCVVIGAAGCASPPTEEVDLAKAMLDKAQAAAAETFAPEAMIAARQAQTVLEDELWDQGRKWFKSYGKAADLAIAAQAAADKATTEATARKDEALAAAAAGTSDDRLGPNLFVNGDFSEGLSGWPKHPDSDVTLSVDVSPAGRAWHAQYRKGNWIVAQQEQPLRPDTVYVYEATIKSTAPVVALYWQSDIGRYHEIDKSYPEWTRLRYVFLTPHWTGKPYQSGFCPVLMKGAGEVWLKDLKLTEFRPRR